MARLWHLGTAAVLVLGAALAGCKKPSRSGEGDDANPAPPPPANARTQDPNRLDMRIAPGLPNSRAAYTIDNATVDTYHGQLQREGPLPGHQRGDPFCWYRLVDPRPPAAAIRATREGQQYVLLCAQPHRTMLHERRPDGTLAWRVVAAEPTIQGDGNVAVKYTLDAEGGRRLSKLMNDHLGAYYCPLLNDVAYGVVHIADDDTGDWTAGIITNVGTRQDAIRLAGMISRIR